MAQSFDASVFIYRAVNLVTSNLVMGILLAVGILWWFMRQRTATLIVALSIPVSLLTTFIGCKLPGAHSILFLSPGWRLQWEWCSMQPLWYWKTLCAIATYVANNTATNL